MRAGAAVPLVVEPRFCAATVRGSGAAVSLCAAIVKVATDIWRCVSTRSNYIITFPSDIVHKMTVSAETHPLEESHHLLQVEFHKGKAPAPLPPDIGKYKCYVLEDEVMQGLMDVKAGSNRAPRMPGEGRARKAAGCR